MLVECGHWFINRILDLPRGPVSPGTTLVIITPEVAADLNWWLYMGPKLNTRVVIQPVPLPQAQSFGIDGHWQFLFGEPPVVCRLYFPAKQFFSCLVPIHLTNLPIHVIEALAMMVAVGLWVPHMPSSSHIAVGSNSIPCQWSSPSIKVDQGKSTLRLPLL